MAALTETINNVEDVKKLPVQEKKDLAETAMNELNAQDQREMRHRLRVPRPGQAAADRIWNIIVTAFAIVLVGAFVALALVTTGAGEALWGNAGTDEVMLTVFTTAAGFLAGLLSPSPLAQNE
jgi:hypothetical protein